MQDGKVTLKHLRQTTALLGPQTQNGLKLNWERFTPDTSSRFENFLYTFKVKYKARGENRILSAELEFKYAMLEDNSVFSPGYFTNSLEEAEDEENIKNLQKMLLNVDSRYDLIVNYLIHSETNIKLKDLQIFCQGLAVKLDNYLPEEERYSADDYLVSVKFLTEGIIMMTCVHKASEKVVLYITIKPEEIRFIPTEIKPEFNLPALAALSLQIADWSLFRHV